MTDLNNVDVPQGGAPLTRPVVRPLLVQMAAYVVLVAVSCLPGSENVGSVAYSLLLFVVGVLIMLSAFFTPLRDGLPGRITACALGCCSMICAATPFLGELVFGVHPDVIEGSIYLSASAWLAGCATLLVVLLVVSFARQMARNPRTNMIVQMSHMVMDGVCCIAAAGWCFLPMLMHAGDVRPLARVLTLAAVAVVAIALGAVSCLWSRDVRPLDDARSPWIGMGMMPVMLTGAAVGIAVLVLLLV